MSKATILLLVGSLVVSGCLVTITHQVSESDAQPTSDADPATYRPALSNAETEQVVAEPEPAQRTEDGARQAIARALPFLAQEGLDWMAGRVPIQGGDACVSCHHVPYGLWSHREAERIGFELDERMPPLETEAVEFLGRRDKARPMSAAPMLSAGAEPVELLTRLLVGRQERDGAFHAVGQFPSQRRPTAESDAVATLWALSALPTDLAPFETEVAAARDAALAWLRTADPGETVEWAAASLVAAPSGDGLEGRRHTLLAAQNDDGGWPWATGEPSNAFSTGQALYALAVAGDSRTEAAEQGRRYLVEDQGPDGSWRVPSAAISKQRSDDRDVIYRYWGTAWAVIGLARSSTD